MLCGQQVRCSCPSAWRVLAVLAMSLTLPNNAQTGTAESSICARYLAELEALAKLDKVYYENPSPTSEERAGYYERQRALESVRLRLYAELEAFRSESQDVFRVKLRDTALQSVVTSSPQCKLRHDLNNYLGVVIGRCMLAMELADSESALAKHLQSAIQMARKVSTRLESDSCPMRTMQTESSITS
jgi:hypothetical protein